jgi:hypothetical protein
MREKELTMDTMLRGALWGFLRPLVQLLTNLLSPRIGEEWEREFKQFLRKEPCWTNEKDHQQTPAILELVSTVVIPATTRKFVAKERFVRDIGPKAKVKISYLGDTFTEWFSSGDEKIEDPITEQTLRYHKLRQLSVDGPIIAELGGAEKSETTLSEMFSLMEKQGKGEDGVLLNNDYANIFYIKDSALVLRTVCVRWSVVGGWYVFARFVEHPRRWRVGYQVFSRNSVLESSEPSA